MHGLSCARSAAAAPTHLQAQELLQVPLQPGAGCSTQPHSQPRIPALMGSGGLGEASVRVLGLWIGLVSEHHWHTGQLFSRDASDT